MVIVFDLGLGSFQIEESQRGFSFLRDEPLKMTFDPQGSLTAEEVVNKMSVNELTKIFREYGEEKNAYRIAKTIVEERKKRRITTTSQLVEIVTKAGIRKTKIHPATKIFQALRIYINDELNNLTEALKESIKILDVKGRIAIVKRKQFLH